MKTRSLILAAMLALVPAAAHGSTGEPLRLVYGADTGSCTDQNGKAIGSSAEGWMQKSGVGVSELRLRAALQVRVDGRWVTRSHVARSKRLDPDVAGARALGDAVTFDWLVPDPSPWRYSSRILFRFRWYGPEGLIEQRTTATAYCVAVI